MCVKEFLGYNCGHCSFPYLRKCPITSQNDSYPACHFPAERPIYTNENCHSCARVVWNSRILKEEEEHRARHYMGECDCPVIFDAEDRERQPRPRPAKGKGRSKEVLRGEDHFNYGWREGNDNGGYGDHHPVGGSEDRATSGYSTEPSGPQVPRLGGDPLVASNQGSSTDSSANNQFTWPSRQLPDQDRSAIEHFHRGEGFPPEGSLSQDTTWFGQTVMNQPGAGMKWYPEHNTNMPVLPPFPTGPPPAPAPAAPASTPPSRKNTMAAARRGSPTTHAKNTKAHAAGVYAARGQAGKIQQNEQSTSYKYATQPTPVPVHNGFHTGEFRGVQAQTPKQHARSPVRKTMTSPTRLPSAIVVDVHIPRAPRQWQKKAMSEGSDPHQFHLTPLDTSVSIETILAHEANKNVGSDQEAPAIASSGMADSMSK
ncbi:hypothetical protein LZ554_002696 [Drepanopeziza brunnea f. sp. 'monogermtubi']|nr:hypothetical protein LZ554_002696 [Drepanopeziza brunnea f. sp. 'monogermtubi']